MEFTDAPLRQRLSMGGGEEWRYLQCSATSFMIGQAWLHNHKIKDKVETREFSEYIFVLNVKRNDI